MNCVPSPAGSFSSSAALRPLVLRRQLKRDPLGCQRSFMIDAQLLDGRRIYAILFLASNWLDRRRSLGRERR
jgi:hypothetical protein